MTASTPLTIIEEAQARGLLGEPTLVAKLVAWLRSELRESHATRLERRSGERIPLTAIFIDIDASDRPPVDPRATEGEGIIAELLGREPRVVTEGLNEAQEQLPECGELVGTLLVAGPGQGKSTLTHYLAQRHRAAVLASRRAELSEEECGILDALEGQPVAGPELPALAHPCMPARIELPAFASWMKREGVESPAGALVEYLRQRIGVFQDGGDAPTPTDMSALLSCVPWLLIFDGLDEVTAAHEHDRVTEAIEALREQLRESSARVIMVATTRPQNYRDQLSRGFTSRYLLPLSQERGVAYAHVLIDLFYTGQRDRQREAKEQLERAYTDPTVARLLQTPLQVAIMAQLIDELGEPPRQRWQLFSAYQDSLINRERRREAAGKLLREHGELIEDVLRHLGLLLQALGERGGDAEAVLTGDELEHVIVERLTAEDFSAIESRELARQIRAVALERLVFLVPAEADRYRFELRSLQEFMAAKALTEGKEPDVEARLEAIGLSGAWTNVLLFAVGHVAHDRRPLRDILIRLCERFNDAAAHPLAGALLAGSSLALKILREEEVNSPKYEAMLASLAVQLLRLPPNEEHVALAHVGGEVDRALEQALSQDWPESAHEEGLAYWVVLARLCERGLEWALELAERRWPADSDAQLQVLWAITSLGHHDGWAKRQLEDHAVELDPRHVQYIMVMGSVSVRVADWQACAHVQVADSEEPLVLHLLEHSPTAELSELSQRLRDREVSSGPWRPFLVAMAFADDPSSASLARALHELAEDFDADLLHWWASQLPWPLAGFLAVVNEPDQLRRWAGEVAAVKYGEARDWFELQERWVEDSVSRADFEASLYAWPYLGAIAHRCGQLDWGWFDLDRILEVASTESSDALETVRGAARWLIRRRGDAASAPPLSVNDAVEMLLGVRRFGPLRLDDVMSTLVGLSNDEIASFFDEFCRRAPYPSIYSNASIERDRQHLAKLAALIVEDPSRQGIIHTLARTVRTAKGAVVSPKTLEIENYDETGVRTNVLVLRLLNSDTLEQIEHDLAEYADLTDDFFVHRAFSHAAGRAKFASEKAQARLFTAMARKSWLPIHADTLRSFQRRLAAYPTHIDDDARWYELNLGPPPPSTFTPPERHPALTSVALHNLRIFADLTLELPPHEGEDGRWLVLLGENGVGKSTLLRAIVLALADPGDVYSLVRDSRVPFLRGGEQLGTATVRLGGIEYKAEISVEHGRERARDRSKNGRERPPLFAYGCARGSAASGEDLAPHDAPVDAVQTLFDDRARLIPASIWLIKLAADTRPSDDAPRPGAQELFDTVRETLSDLLPGVDRVEVDGSGPWFYGPKIGQRVPLGSLSDGYITTIGWIVDLLARWVRRQTERGLPLGPGFNKRMTGLVLVDEIDLHLHPSWQREVIAKVRGLFPAMHFIVTTHNPLTLLSARPGEIIVLERPLGDPSAPVRTIQRDLPPGIRADQILTGEWFGLVSTRDAETLGLLERHYGHLRDGVPVDDPERVRVSEELGERLDHFPGTTLEQLVRSVAAELHEGRYPQLTPEMREATRRGLAQRARKREVEGG